MSKDHIIPTYVNRNILISPEADAECFLQDLIVLSKKGGKSEIKICLHDYRKNTLLCDFFVNEVEQLLNDSQVQQELANCERLEIYGTYIDDGPVLNWLSQSFE